MKPAENTLRIALNSVEIRTPIIPIVSNVTAAPVTCPSQIRELLASQVTAPVEWCRSIHRLWEGQSLGGMDIGVRDNQVNEWICIGPGVVMRNLIRKEFPEAILHMVDTVQDIQQFTLFKCSRQ